MRERKCMTRAGLELASYGAKERMLIAVLAWSSIAKSCPGGNQP